MVQLSTANTYSYQKGELPLLVAQPACWHPEQHQPVLTGSFPAVDLPFQEYVEQLLHPQNPKSLGKGEPDLGSSGVRRRHLALPRCQDPCTLLCSLLADTLYFFEDNFTEWALLFQHYSPPTVCWVPLLLTALGLQVGALQDQFAGWGSADWV